MAYSFLLLISFSSTLEYILIGGIILFQLYFSINVAKGIRIFGDIFDVDLTTRFGYIQKELLKVADQRTIDHVKFSGELDNDNLNRLEELNLQQLILIDSKSQNDVVVRIKYSINNYLLNNFGAPVNFSIIKDMIDREVDVKDEDISQSISVPLYTGLAATMLGIIFGLFGMPEMAMSAQFSDGIQALIDGVKISMGASLTGLVCTTVLSSFLYKDAKKKVLRDKNNQFSYLQAKLLPELIKAEDSGLAGLKQSLERFSSEARSITNNISQAVIHTSQSIGAQQQVLDKIERMNVTKVSKVNLELFDRLDSNMEALTHFSSYLSTIKEISQNMSDFAKRTASVDSLTKHIGETIDESRDLNKFLAGHFQAIESYGSQALKAVDYSDSHFREAIEKLTEDTKTRIDVLNELSDSSESHIKEVFEDISIKLNKITAHYLDEFKVAFSNATPQLEHLNYLKALPPIKKSLDRELEVILSGNKLSESLVREVASTRSETLRNSSNENEKLIQAINELSKNLTGRESSSNSPKKFDVIMKYSELTLRILAWIAITSFGVHTVLQYFDLIR
jgi:hypothetical protein